MKLSLIVPWDTRNTDRYRANSFNYTLDWWEENFPNIEVCIGINSDPIFNRSKARNAAIEKATGDVLIISDADTVPCRDSIRHALRYVGDRWVIPYDTYYNLSREYTDLVLSGEPLNEPTESQYEHRLISWAGVLMLNREAIDQVGGYDERFEGWGHEDVAFRVKLDSEYCKHVRVSGYVSHLWHHVYPEQTFNSESELKNRQLFDKEYRMRYNWRDERI